MRKGRSNQVSMFTLISASPTKWLLTVALLLQASLALALDGKPQGVEGEHEQIIKEALSGTVCEANLKVIVIGAQSQDQSTFATDKYRHFEEPNLLKSLNFIEREKRKVLNFCAAADTDEKSRACALYHFGQILHTLQDFYSKSNYLELKLSQLHHSTNSCTKEELYGLPLADWSSLIALLRNGEKSNIVVEGVDKSDPASPESMRSISGLTYFAIARELAVRETERQWRQLESLVKARLQNNATAVIVSLKSAGCPQQVVSEMLGKAEELVPEL
jgi:hypothetical protein